MKIENLKKLLSDKRQHLRELEYDHKYCHSDSLRRQANSQIFMIKVSIDILESRIIEAEK